MKEEFQNLYITLGAKVKTYRQEKGWSQEELASRCSVNRAKISRIENARKDYMLSTLLEVFKALELNLNELFNLEKNI